MPVFWSPSAAATLDPFPPKSEEFAQVPVPFRLTGFQEQLPRLIFETDIHNLAFKRALTPEKSTAMRLATKKLHFPSTPK